MSALIDIGLPLLAVAVLITLNALFVFHEFAYVSISPAQLRRIDTSSSRFSSLVANGVHRLDHYIAVDQLGITATSIGVGWVGQPAVSEILSTPLSYLGISGGAVTVAITVVAFSLITGTQMVLGELVPKTVALRHAERVAYLVAVPIEVSARLMHPAVVMLNGLGAATVRLLGFEPEGEGHRRALTSSEFADVVERSSRAGMTTADPRSIRMVLGFSAVEARDIMLPRHAITAISEDATTEELLELGRSYRHARYPVYRESIDHIIGLLNIKELVQFTEDGEPAIVSNWKEWIRPIPALPSTTSIEHLLYELRRTKQEMAVLIDEYGGTDGIVTVTSVARHAVGEDTAIRRAGPGRYLVQGQLGLTALETALGISLEAEDAATETIGGLVMEGLGRIPEPGDQIQTNGIMLRVITMDDRRVEQVLLEREPAPPARLPDDPEST